MADAIQRLVTRGAPALGCAAAYGMVLELAAIHSPQEWLNRLHENAVVIRNARPTAVNLSVGVQQQWTLGQRLHASGGTPAEWTDKLLKSAHDFHHADQASCLALSEIAFPLLNCGMRILTHCNAGALATGGIGTALGPIHLAHSRGIDLLVFADETRPLRQGARLTAWELARHGISVDVLPDSAAATLLAQGQVDLIFVGSDRIAANGDVANKLGTYPLAVMAQRHKVPFYVLAPGTTVDPLCATGAEIPIEKRGAEELYPSGTAPAHVGVFNPAFDVTPHDLVTAIITDQASFTLDASGRPAWDSYVAELRSSR